MGLVASLLLSLPVALFAAEPYGPDDAKITIVVMDPMSLPLACDCVQGYAQRKYEKLADYLQKDLGDTVRVVWSESLEKALEQQTMGKATIVIGKDSVVRADAKKSKLELTPVAQLTDMAGSVMQHGLFVVRKADKAASLLDIDGYKVLWGPDDCEEKAGAPKAKLKELEISFSDGGACDSCSVAAKKLLEEPENAKVVAVISSYAEPLLAGCGTIKKGDLRVIGKSDEVPFVSAFVHNDVPENRREAIVRALLELNKSKDLLTALESKEGFVAYASREKR
jgi:ABC-type phosphate/phosphonate transport system substrate-binding protein